MNKEFTNLLKSIMENPSEAAEKVNDEYYKSIFPEKVYEWHKKYKGNKSWIDYIADVLISDFQFNNFYND